MLAANCPQNMNKYISDKILEYVRKHPEGVSIEQVAKETKHTRHTVVRYLDWLTWKSFITRREVGRVKLHYPVPEAEFKKGTEVKK